MSIISSSLISDNLNFAVANMTTTLTAVTPTNSEIYVANKQDVEVAFEIFEDGREVTIDTRFYLNKTSHTDLPTKGMVLTDGSSNFKVMSTHNDSANITLRIDCSAQHQR
jgi:hypothetical protein|tara:strand:- start:629 stop:958 length:330 start_codon:yes stop_codon:yes gene_type:complete